MIASVYKESLNTWHNQNITLRELKEATKIYRKSNWLLTLLFHPTRIFHWGATTTIRDIELLHKAMQREYLDDEYELTGGHLARLDQILARRELRNSSSSRKYSSNTSIIVRALKAGLKNNITAFTASQPSGVNHNFNALTRSDPLPVSGPVSTTSSSANALLERIIQNLSEHHSAIEKLRNNAPAVDKERYAQFPDLVIFDFLMQEYGNKYYENGGHEYTLYNHPDLLAQAMHNAGYVNLPAINAHYYYDQIRADFNSVRSEFPDRGQQGRVDSFIKSMSEFSSKPDSFNSTVTVSLNGQYFIAGYSNGVNNKKDLVKFLQEWSGAFIHFYRTAKHLGDLKGLFGHYTCSGICMGERLRATAAWITRLDATASGAVKTHKTIEDRILQVQSVIDDDQALKAYMSDHPERGYNPDTQEGLAALDYTLETVGEEYCLTPDNRVFQVKQRPDLVAGYLKDTYFLEGTPEYPLHISELLGEINKKFLDDELHEAGYWVVRPQKALAYTLREFGTREFLHTDGKIYTIGQRKDIIIDNLNLQNIIIKPIEYIDDFITRCLGMLTTTKEYWKEDWTSQTACNEVMRKFGNDSILLANGTETTANNDLVKTLILSCFDGTDFPALKQKAIEADKEDETPATESPSVTM